MKVSIITVCMNSAATIEQTISSVLNQTYTDIEYIIIDGGSMDGTIDTIKKYESQISYWVSETDHGLYDAMNKGIKLASGEIIGIINSDDRYDLSTVDKVVKCFKETKTELVHGNRVEFSSLNNCVSIRAPQTEALPIYSILTYLHPTVFVKKVIYEKYGGFNCRYVVAADQDLILRFYMKGVRFCYLPEVLTYFRIGGISGRLKWRGVREQHRIVDAILNELSVENKVNCIEMENRRFEDARMAAVQKFIDKRLARKNFYQYKKFFLNEKRLIIFGTGFWGTYFYKWCTSQGLEVKYFVDNSTKRQNDNFFNLEIKHPQTLIKKDKNDIIIVAIKDGRAEIAQQLIQMNFCYDKDFLFHDEVLKEIYMQYILSNFSFIFKARKHES